MNVVAHPTAARIVASPRPEPTYGLMELRHMFGLRDRQTFTPAVKYVRLMIEHRGFPAPLPRFRGRLILDGAAAVAPAARWSRRPVDAWFDGLLPPGARDALAAATASEADATLDARADNLDALLRARRA